MLWNVYGHDPQTGELTSIEVESSSLEGAAKTARSYGIAVTSVAARPDPGAMTAPALPAQDPLPIELTSKQMKLHMILAMALSAVGVIAAFFGALFGSARTPYAARWLFVAGCGAIVFIVGLLWYGAARLVAWWQRG